MSSPWAVLGIPRTTDVALIRAAYAKLLKVTNPEDDAAAFQALRAAYDGAMASARGAPRRATAGDMSLDVRQLPRRPVQPEPVSVVDEASRHNESPPERAPDPRPVAEPPRFHIPQGWSSPDLSPPKLEPRADRPDPPQADIDRFAASRQAFERLLFSDDARQAEITKAFADLLVDLDARSVDWYSRTEAWIAGLILRSSPLSDPLVEPAFVYFKWADDQFRQPSAQVLALRSRREDIAYVRRLNQRGSGFREGYRALAALPPRGRQWLSRVIQPRLRGQVRELLRLTRQERPAILSRFAASTVAWWDEELQRPYLGFASWLMVFGAPLLAALILGQSETSGPDYRRGAIIYLAGVGCVAGVLAAKHLAIDWPRFFWRRRLAALLPAWVGLAWAPALLGLVAAAAVLPPSLFVAIPIGVLSLAACLWALVVADPDRSPERGAAWEMGRWVNIITIGAFLTQPLWAPNMRMSRGLRTLFTFGYLALFWLAISSSGLSQPSVVAMTAPVVLAAVGFAGGLGSLMAAWNALSPQARLNGFWGLAGLWAAALGLAVGAVHWPMLAAPAAGLATLSALLAKAPGEALPEASTLWRAVLMRYGWLPLMIVGLMIGARSLLFAGVAWIATSAGMTALAGLRLPRARNRVKPLSFGA